LTERLEIIDAQLHCWDSDSPERPWNPNYGRRDAVEAANRRHQSEHPVTSHEIIRRMDAAGVDAAVLVTIAAYAPDNSYALEAARTYPGRYAVVGRIDHTDPELDARVAGWRGEGMVGIRLILGSEAERSAFRAGDYDALFAACERHRVPLCVFPPGILGELVPVARRHPGLPLVLDHLGLASPPLMRADDPPFGRLPELLALAELPNVAVKLTGICALSGERYPFADLWPHIHRLLGAFGPDRLLWGSDSTRTESLFPYREAVAFMSESGELSDADRHAVMGGSLRRIFAWPR
jgi:L-fuconolactonase